VGVERRSLPLISHRPARIVLLVFRDADTDSRVLKTASSLRAAGAEVLIVGLAPYRSSLRPGDDLVGDGLALHRTQDLDLVRALGPLVRLWRRLGSRDPITGMATTRGTAVEQLPNGDGSLPEQTPAIADTRDAGRPSRRTTGMKPRLNDVYMRGYRTIRLVKYWAGAVAAARRFEADVVHANDGNTLAPAIFLRLVTGARIVYDSHELWLRRNVRADRWLAPFVESVTERLGVRMADAVITVSPSIAAWLKSTYHLPESPMVVRNVPVWEGAPSRSKGRLREMAGLTPSERVVSYCGGITTGRGLEETVDALAVLPDDVHFVVLGFGPPGYRAELLRRARDLGVERRVHLVGHVAVPDVPQTLADADLAIVFVRPIVLSYRYCLPNKLFESIHAGLPIVSADLPDCADVVRNHGVGEVFSTRTPGELAAATTRVLAHSERYRDAARAFAPQLDWRMEAGRLIEAHSRAVQRCRP